MQIARCDQTSQQILEQKSLETLIAEHLVRKYMDRHDNLKRPGWMESELTTALEQSGWDMHGDRVKCDLSTPAPTHCMVAKTEYSQGGGDTLPEDVSGQ